MTNHIAPWSIHKTMKLCISRDSISLWLWHEFCDTIDCVVPFGNIMFSGKLRPYICSLRVICELDLGRTQKKSFNGRASATAAWELGSNSTAHAQHRWKTDERRFLCLPLIFNHSYMGPKLVGWLAGCVCVWARQSKSASSLLDSPSHLGVSGRN